MRENGTGNIGAVQRATKRGKPLEKNANKRLNIDIRHRRNERKEKQNKSKNFKVTFM